MNLNFKFHLNHEIFIKEEGSLFLIFPQFFISLSAAVAVRALFSLSLEIFIFSSSAYDAGKWLHLHGVRRRCVWCGLGVRGAQQTPLKHFSLLHSPWVKHISSATFFHTFPSTEKYDDDDNSRGEKMASAVNVLKNTGAQRCYGYNSILSLVEM